MSRIPPTGPVQFRDGSYAESSGLWEWTGDYRLRRTLWGGVVLEGQQVRRVWMPIVTLWSPANWQTQTRWKKRDRCFTRLQPGEKSGEPSDQPQFDPSFERHRIVITRTTGGRNEQLVNLEGWVPLDDLLNDAELVLISLGKMKWREQ